MFEPTFFSYEWDPFEEMDRVRRRFERVLDGAGPSRFSVARVAGPRVDVFDAGASFVVEAELPGFKSDDVSVTVENDVLTLSGHRPAQPRDGYSLHRRERAEAPKFSRSFTLPARVDAERVEAELADGILTVTLPKAAESRPRQISIKAS
jgi:HSP20 family protein